MLLCTREACLLSVSPSPHLRKKTLTSRANLPAPYQTKQKTDPEIITHLQLWVMVGGGTQKIPPETSSDDARARAGS